jgi:IS5 family transposase
VPDETTVCRFRHLLEEHDLGRQLFDKVQQHLADNGPKVATGRIVDATIISAPSSTKNATKARDPELRDWVFVVTNVLMLNTALFGQWIYLHNKRRQRMAQ